MSFKGGVSSFIDHLQKQISADWQLGTAVTAIESIAGGFRVSHDDNEREFDKVVVCSPAFAAANMLESLDSELASRLRTIDYSPIAVVGFGYRQLQHDLDGFGLLTTTAARQSILGVLWDSSVFPDRAPPGCKALRVMLGGQRNPDLVGLDEASLVETARQGLRQTMGIDESPDVVYVRRWDRGIPSYAPGHIERVERIFDRASRHAGLYLTSNAYRGIAMNDAVLQARQTADQLAADIAGFAG